MRTHELGDCTVLVTGGAGFIGSHLANALAGETDLRILDSFTTGRREQVPDGATVVEGDVRDEDALARATTGVDLIFHEAALVSVERSVENPLESHSVNVDATLALLERARALDARIVLASSAAIYGQPERAIVSESGRKLPSSPYGLEKLAVDHYARQYHDLYGLETVALRYFNVYGPGQFNSDYSGVITAFIDRALAGELISVHGDGGQTRDFVFVEDVVRANLLAATTDRVGGAYNVGTGRAISIRELAELIVDVTDSDSEIVHTDERVGDIRHSQADIGAARADLGYAPEVSLREGLERTVEWAAASNRLGESR
ncbi:NAD-dependent epimerase/dehydratase family protein [Halosolutus gelatinilyticus]|uniref:NAD-dependent epimerase/dehydratase family protein n=1 Tax=Halosolutus gelatinilyticus TaxID=2931975 RepID=UPI001FF6C685|nr:NAD-dependent epimerase/dehydratase family protein [Halosolutus gelatinilyticus]